MPGDPRLTLGGLFYESGFSDRYHFDHDNNYYIFVNNYAGNALTYAHNLSNDRIEGLESMEITVLDAEAAWWAGGVIANTNPVDLSEWTTLHVSFKGTDPSFEDMFVLLAGGGTEVRVNVINYGFQADGQWHSLVIPLSDFVGVDFESTNLPFVFGADVGTDGSTVLIDDLYFTQE